MWYWLWWTVVCSFPCSCWLYGIRPVGNWVVGCWRGYLSGARCRLAYSPADATATHCLLLQWNPDWFYLSGSDSPGGSPGQRAVERVWSLIVWSYIDACWVWSVWWCMYQCVGVWQELRWNEYFAVCARCFWWFISKLSRQNDDTFKICDIMFIWVISPERPSSAAYSMSSGVVMILMIFLTEIAIFRHQSFDFSKSKEILIKVKIAFFDTMSADFSERFLFGSMTSLISRVYCYSWICMSNMLLINATSSNASVLLLYEFVQICCWCGVEWKTNKKV